MIKDNQDAETTVNRIQRLDFVLQRALRLTDTLEKYTVRKFFEERPTIEGYTWVSHDRSNMIGREILFDWTLCYDGCWRCVSLVTQQLSGVTEMKIYVPFNSVGEEITIRIPDLGERTLRNCVWTRELEDTFANYRAQIKTDRAAIKKFLRMQYMFLERIEKSYK
jgi:hypothetical protein